MQNIFALRFLPLIAAVFTASPVLADQVLSLKYANPATEVVIVYDKKAETRIPMNKLVALKATVKSNEELSLTSFDAVMPEHKHGMLTKAVVKKLPKNAYEISGIKLHMPGRWVILVNLADKKGKVYTLTENYVAY